MQSTTTFSGWVEHRSAAAASHIYRGRTSSVQLSDKERVILASMKSVEAALLSVLLCSVLVGVISISAASLRMLQATGGERRGG